MFELPDKNPRFNQAFNTIMHNQTIMITNKILESYKGFGKLKKVVDVGGVWGQHLV